MFLHLLRRVKFRILKARLPRPAGPTLGISRSSRKNSGTASKIMISAIETESLPVALPQAVKAAKKSPNEMLQEAFGFSIIGRNIDLMGGLLDRIELSSIDASGHYLLHMAATYLDGLRTCCDILDLLLNRIEAVFGAADRHVNGLYINELGYTVLDSLMVTI